MTLERFVPGGLFGHGARFGAVAVVAGLVLLSGCQRIPDVVKIGVAQPLTGTMSALGQDMLNGAQMAVDEINAAGGVDVHGKRVTLQIDALDDKGNTDAGDSAAHKLVDDDVEVAIADLNSGVSIHAAPIYAMSHIPQMSISTKTAYTKLGLSTTLRLVGNDDLQARAMGVYASQLGGTHYAVVDDGTPYGKDLATAAGKVLVESGKKIELRESLDDKTTDFAALIAEFASAKTDTLVSTLSDFQVDALMTQLAKAGLTGITIVGGDTLKTDKLLGKPVPIRALYVTSAIGEPKEFASGKAFLEKFRQLHKADPVYAAHYAYDAVYLVADAMSRNASVDKDALLATLKTFDGNCPMTNAIRFAADGEQRYGSVAVYQMRDGAWDPLMRSDRW